MPSSLRGRRRKLWGGSRTSRTGRSTRGEEATKTGPPPRWTRSVRLWSSKQGSRVRKDLQRHPQGPTSTLWWEEAEGGQATDHLQGEEEEDEGKAPGRELFLSQGPQESNQRQMSSALCSFGITYDVSLWDLLWVKRNWWSWMSTLALTCFFLCYKFSPIINCLMSAHLWY